MRKRPLSPLRLLRSGQEFLLGLKVAWVVLSARFVEMAYGLRWRELAFEFRLLKLVMRKAPVSACELDHFLASSQFAREEGYMSQLEILEEERAREEANDVRLQLEGILVLNSPLVGHGGRYRRLMDVRRTLCSGSFDELAALAGHDRRGLYQRRGGRRCPTR